MSAIVRTYAVHPLTTGRRILLVEEFYFAIDIHIQTYRARPLRRVLIPCVADSMLSGRTCGILPGHSNARSNPAQRMALRNEVITSVVGR